MKSKDSFGLFWKSKYSSGNEFEKTLKQIDNEIESLSLGITKSNYGTVIKGISSLLDYRTELSKNLDSTLMEKCSREKKEMLKRLYSKTWGSMAGMTEGSLEKMSDAEVDAAIKTLALMYD